MQTFVVLRPGIASTAAELDAALMRLRQWDDEPRALNARWLHSYALREPDGRLGLACIFEADRATTLAQHAELACVASTEILPVTAALIERAFAREHVYLVRRRAAWTTFVDLKNAAGASRRVADDEMSRTVTWIRSYAVAEVDGTFGTVCIYRAIDAAALTEHAARVGMPADDIVPVIGRIVVRDEPLHEIASSLALQFDPLTNIQGERS